ncbi:MAG: hypothetical protein ACQETE_01565 [Bacteroidota bacterium]
MKSFNHKTLVDQLVHGNAQRVHEKSDTVTYVGFSRTKNASDTEAVWRIQRITESTINGTETLTKIEYAATGDFDQVWDDRETLTYGGS